MNRGKQTFVDEIIEREDSSLGFIFHPSNSLGIHIPRSSYPPHLETSFSSVAKVENSSPTTPQATLENTNSVEDQASVAQNRKIPEEPEHIYRIKGQLVTKE